jgi:predicted dehydrogenase
VEYSFNWGIIGYGNIAKNFERNIFEKKNNTLRGISSKSKKIKDKKNLNLYNDELHLLANQDINSVYVSNLNNQHFESAINCIKNKKNFIIEKPSFINVDEKNQFIKSLELSNSFMIEGYMNLYHPQMSLVNDLILDNEIGNLIKIESTIGFSIIKKFLFFEYYKYKKNHRLLDQNKGGGAIFDIGCYGIATTRKIINNIFKEDIDFNLTNIEGKIGQTNIDESASASLLFDNNITSSIKCSIIKNLDNKIKIFGADGFIEILEPWTPTEGAKIILENKKGKKIIHTGTKKSAYWYEIDFFNKMIMANLEIKKKIKNNQIKDIEKNTMTIIRWLNRLTDPIN